MGRVAKKEIVKGWVDLPLSSLVKAPWNYKEDDAAMLAKLKANIKRNGQVVNLIVREMPEGGFEVVNGNHRVDALLDLKQTEVHCFNLGTISDAAARRIAIETNETNFETNYLALGKTIGEMLEEFSQEDLLGSLPYDEAKLTSILNMKDFDLAGEAQKIKDNSPTAKKDKDFENDFQQTQIPIAAVLKSFGCDSLSKEEAEVLGEALIRARVALNIPLKDDPGPRPFMHIVKFYMEKEENPCPATLTDPSKSSSAPSLQPSMRGRSVRTKKSVS